MEAMAFLEVDELIPPLVAGPVLVHSVVWDQI